MTFKEYIREHFRGYNEIAKELDDAYEQGAPQEHIDALETELAQWVSEDEETHEGISVEEELRNMYARYINPQKSRGMTKEDILGNMRDVVISNGGKETITDEELLDAAKDAYYNFKKYKI